MIWKAVAVFFYVELVLCCLLLFPVLSARRWRKLIDSRLVATVWSYSKSYFVLFSLLLIGLFIGAVNGIRKQEKKRSHPLPPEEANIVLQQLFRAQRNFYITLFASLLLFVLYRIGSLILTQAALEDEEEEIQQQRRMTAEMVTCTSTEPDAREKEQIRLELFEAKDEIKKLKEKLRDANKHKEMMEADLENSRTEIQDLSHMCSEMKLKLEKTQHHQGLPEDKEG